MAGNTAEAIAGLISRAWDEPLPLIAFTDEELAVLDGGPDAPHFTPRPWLDAQDKSARALACEVALRGLAIRRLAVPVGVDEDRAVTLVLHDDIRAALAMRWSAEAIVIAHRDLMSGDPAAPARTRTCVLHCHGEGVLEEIIEPGGAHAFTVTTKAAAAQRLAAFADPAGAAGDGPAGTPRTVTLAEIAAGAEAPDLGSASCVTAVQFASRNPPQPVGAAALTEDQGGTDERRLTVYAFSDHVVLSEPAAGTADVLTLVTVSQPVLEQRLRAIVS